jgi:hypothetical protein
MPEPLPDEEVAFPADPFEAELVAYLDGELDPAAARRIETRLAGDPQARAKAAALKKTFDLLDYLPKPEPSATFTSRTLDKLPALQPGSPPQPAVPQPLSASAASRSQPKSSRVSQSVAAPVASQRIPTPPLRHQAMLPLTSGPTHSRRMIWAAGILLAATGFAAAGYLCGHAFRSHPSTSQSVQNKDANDELALSDRRLIENLPLYAVVDDYAFVNELARAEYFGDDPTVAYDTALKVPSIPREMPSGNALATLEKAFKQLSSERQQIIRELDKKLYAAPSNLQDRLLRVMEIFAVWLNLLSENDRRNVLSAATSDIRLKQIRIIRDRQWVETLPPSQQKQLSVATDALKSTLIEEWKQEDIRRRKEWASARRNPSETLDASKPPLLFNDETERNNIENFARVAFRIDDPKKCRLTSNDLDRYNKALSFAKEQGGAAWFTYGKTLYELVKKPEHEELLLPPPDSKTRIADFPDLPVVYQKFVLQRLKSKLTPLVGKWPEFPLELHKDMPQFHQYHKEGLGKTDFPKIDLKSLPPLGPSRVSEFAQPARGFVEEKMLNNKLLGISELKRLQEKEGKWPEYSREIIQLAREHNLSIPGVMLPGPPKSWDALYGPSRTKQ